MIRTHIDSVEPKRLAPRDPPSPVLAALTALAVVLGVLVSSALVAGCGVSREDRELIEVHAAVIDSDIEKWPTLTDEQKRARFVKHARGWHVLDYSINGKLLAEKWRVKPATADAVTPR